MITNDGVELISKYLAGEASSYASYIAIGCGARPLSSINTVTVGDTMVISNVAGTGPYTATITTNAENLNYLQVGDIISSITIPPATGSLGSGTVTVTAITGQKTFTVSSTAALTSGTISVVFIKSSIDSSVLSSKTKLDFEMARFPITSRSYVVDKQVAKCSSMFIVGTNTVTVLTSSAHPFGVGDTVFITDVDYISTGPTTDTQVNGMYVISSTSASSFTAVQYDNTLGDWGSSLFGYPGSNEYKGYSYNNLQFNATVYTKQVSLTAEVSDISQYDITELGLYSLGSNQYSTALDSRMLLSFTQTESWQYFDYASSSFLDVPVIDSITTSFPTAFSTSPFFVSSNDAYWTADGYRTLRQEKPRMLSDAIVLPGALSNWSSANTFTSNSDYLRLDNPGIDLSKNSSQDQLSLAFSIVNAKSTTTAIPTAYYIMFEFVSSNGKDSAKVTFSETSLPVNPNRYVVSTTTVGNVFYPSTNTNFNWSDVTSLKIYSAIEVSGTPTDDFAIVLDGLRLENVTTKNPLYALTAYTVVNSDGANKIEKGANSKDLINFRLDLAIGS